jgi:hypothetical protein
VVEIYWCLTPSRAVGRGHLDAAFISYQHITQYDRIHLGGPIRRCGPPKPRRGFLGTSAVLNYTTVRPWARAEPRQCRDDDQMDQPHRPTPYDDGVSLHSATKEDDSTK